MQKYTVEVKTDSGTTNAIKFSAGNPVSIVHDRKIDRYYVAGLNDHQIYVVNPDTFEAEKKLPFANNPHYLTMDYKRRYMLVSRYGSSAVDIVDIADNFKVLQTFSIPNPRGTCHNTDEDIYILVGNDGKVHTVDPKNNFALTVDVYKTPISIPYAASYDPIGKRYLIAEYNQVRTHLIDKDFKFIDFLKGQRGGIVDIASNLFVMADAATVYIYNAEKKEITTTIPSTTTNANSIGTGIHDILRNKYVFADQVKGALILIKA